MPCVGGGGAVPDVPGRLPRTKQSIGRAAQAQEDTPASDDPGGAKGSLFGRPSEEHLAARILVSTYYKKMSNDNHTTDSTMNQSATSSLRLSYSCITTTIILS
jgi:hypothetical protein